MSLPHRRVVCKDGPPTRIRLLPIKAEGRHIRAMTFLCGFTQKEIAAGLGISPVNVHRVIYGKIRSARIEAEIARILGKADWNEVVLEARSEVQKKPVAVILQERQQARDEQQKAAGEFYSNHMSRRIGEVDVIDLRTSQRRRGA